jgi:hypothetical protein
MTLIGTERLPEGFFASDHFGIQCDLTVRSTSSPMQPTLASLSDPGTRMRASSKESNQSSLARPSASTPSPSNDHPPKKHKPSKSTTTSQSEVIVIEDD